MTTKSDLRAAERINAHFDDVNGTTTSADKIAAIIAEEMRAEREAAAMMRIFALGRAVLASEAGCEDVAVGVRMCVADYDATQAVGQEVKP